MDYIDKIRIKLKEWGTIYRGCSEQEIEILETSIGSKLPKYYRQFLKEMGKSMDRIGPNNRGYLAGTAVFYEHLFENKEYGLLELLLEDQRLDLIEKVTDNHFVFYDSQGILSAFFRLDEGENPPVYGYKQGYTGDGFPLISESIEDFFIRVLESDHTLFQEVS